MLSLRFAVLSLRFDILSLRFDVLSLRFAVLSLGFGIYWDLLRFLFCWLLLPLCAYTEVFLSLFC